MTRTVPTVITGLIVGALFSLAAVGTRGYNFLFTFILTSGFVIGVGLLVNMGWTRFLLSQKQRKELF